MSRDGRRSSVASVSEDPFDPSRRTSQTNPADSSGDELEGKSRPTGPGRKITPAPGAVRSGVTRFADQNGPPQQPSAIMEAMVEEGEEADKDRRRTASDIVEIAPSAEIARLKERMAHSNVGSIGRQKSKPLLRRLSTAIGIDAFGGGSVKEDEPSTKKDEITEIMPNLNESTHVSIW